jgi:hypothetical protein
MAEKVFVVVLISWVEFYIEEAAWGSRGATSDTSRGSGRD